MVTERPCQAAFAKASVEVCQCRIHISLGGSRLMNLLDAFETTAFAHIGRSVVAVDAVSNCRLVEKCVAPLLPTLPWIRVVNTGGKSGQVEIGEPWSYAYGNDI